MVGRAPGAGIAGHGGEIALGAAVAGRRALQARGDPGAVMRAGRQGDPCGDVRVRGDDRGRVGVAEGHRRGGVRGRGVTGLPRPVRRFGSASSTARPPAVSRCRRLFLVGGVTGVDRARDPLLVAVPVVGHVVAGAGGTGMAAGPGVWRRLCELGIAIIISKFVIASCWCWEPPPSAGAGRRPAVTLEPKPGSTPRVSSPAAP